MSKCFPFLLNCVKFRFVAVIVTCSFAILICDFSAANFSVFVLNFARFSSIVFLSFQIPIFLNLLRLYFLTAVVFPSLFAFVFSLSCNIFIRFSCSFISLFVWSHQ